MKVRIVILRCENYGKNIENEIAACIAGDLSFADGG